MKWFEARVVGLVKQQQGQAGAQGQQQQQQGEEEARLVALVREVRQLAGAGCCSLEGEAGFSGWQQSFCFVANTKCMNVCACL